MKKLLYIVLTIMLTAAMSLPYITLAAPDQAAGQNQAQQQTPAESGESTGGGGTDSGSGQSEADTGGQSSGNAQSGDQSSSGSETDQSAGSQNTDSQSSNSQNSSNNSSQQNSGGQAEKKAPEQSKKTVSVIYTADMHSHLDSVNSTGGSARLMTRINKIKGKYPESFVLDAGDFSMGTAFQSIFTAEASELRMMGELGYDAAAIGDHELDYGARGLGRMIKRAAAAKRIDKKYTSKKDVSTGRSYTEITGDQFMPRVVCSNIDWDTTFENKDLAKDAKYLKRQFNKYGVADYTVIEKNSVKIAVFGIVDENARNQIVTKSVQWDDSKQRAQQIVDEIKRNKEADIIVCLNNSSFMNEDAAKDSDKELAEAVPGIDVMISAHENTSYREPVIAGNTIIVSPGGNTEYAGNLVLRKENGRFVFKKNRLYRLDSKTGQNEQIQYKVNNYKELVNSHYFSKYGYTYGETLAKSDSSFEMLDRFKIDREDNALGNMIADSFIYGVRKAEGKKYENVDVAVVPNAEIRSTLTKGDITTSDAFNVLSLGHGRDGTAGYPLVSVYFTGKELKRLAEIDATLSSKNEDVILHTSGLAYNFNDHRLFLNRAVDIGLVNGETRNSIVNGKLYRVVAGLHTFDILAAVERRSKGLLALLPKDKDGNEIKDLSEHIVRKGRNEVKEWYALASYIDSFSGDTVPQAYNGRDGRKNDKTSYAPWALIRQPNNYGVMLGAGIMIPVVIIIGLVIHLRQRRISRRGYDKSMFDEKSSRRRKSRGVR